MQTPDVLVAGIVFGEQPRWHDGRLWFSDWGTQEVIAVDRDGTAEVVHSGASFPLCVDWLPDGRLLVVDTSAGRLLAQKADGSFEMFADLRQGSDPPAGNELVVDGRGNAYVNGGGFDMMAGEPYAPGGVVLVTPDGRVPDVASLAPAVNSSLPAHQTTLTTSSTRPSSSSGVTLIRPRSHERSSWGCGELCTESQQRHLHTVSIPGILLSMVTKKGQL